MIIWGITAQTHDASLAVVKDGELLFAAQAERYSQVKNDPDINDDLIRDALWFGKPDVVAYYENPWLKKYRQLATGSWKHAFNISRLPSRYLRRHSITAPLVCVDHHLSHAAAGYLTSPFNEATILVIDSVGEWATTSVWRAKGTEISLCEQVNFPSSLGLFYSAFTRRCGLKPNEEEYILMGMAAYGNPLYAERILSDFFVLDRNLFHCKQSCVYGVGQYLPEATVEDIAASAQVVTETVLTHILAQVKKRHPSNNLVYMGGVALNCLANRHCPNYFPNIWIMPNPGDAGSAVGSAAKVYGGKIKWRSPYLGHNIQGYYDVDKVVSLLQEGEVLGVARGRAEFGPRALGNRSILADPRFPYIKDKVNDIKRRQRYRPFAPVIPQEIAAEYFDMSCGSSPYMQFVARCKCPELFPAITHVDGTSRVQTVTKEQNPQLYTLLQAYREKTGCPMLLNTSLNIRGKPLVNSLQHAKEFSELYGVPVL